MTAVLIDYEILRLVWWLFLGVLLIGWIALDYRRQQRRLRELEASGVVRRSGRSATETK